MYELTTHMGIEHVSLRTDSEAVATFLAKHPFDVVYFANVYGMEILVTDQLLRDWGLRGIERRAVL